MCNTDLIELLDGTAAFLKDIALQKGSVDILPLITELLSQVLVELSHSLPVSS